MIYTIAIFALPNMAIMYRTGYYNMYFIFIVNLLYFN